MLGESTEEFENQDKSMFYNQNLFFVVVLRQDLDIESSLRLSPQVLELTLLTTMPVNTCLGLSTGPATPTPGESEAISLQEPLCLPCWLFRECFWDFKGMLENYQSCVCVDVQERTHGGEDRPHVTCAELAQNITARIYLFLRAWKPSR